MTISNRKAALLWRLETAWETLENDREEAVEFRDFIAHLGRKSGRKNGGWPTEKQLNRALAGCNRTESEYAGYGAGSNQTGPR